MSLWILVIGAYMEFEVFHLKEDDEALLEQVKQLRMAFRKPDESILLHYCLNQSHMDECRSKHKVSINEHYKEKCLLAKKIKKAGGFVKVADVTADHMIDAYIKTTSINQRWFITPSKGVTPLGQSLRSTQSYDLMCWDSEDYLIMPIGYLNIDTGEFFELKRH